MPARAGGAEAPFRTGAGDEREVPPFVPDGGRGGAALPRGITVFERFFGIQGLHAFFETFLWCITVALAEVESDASKAEWARSAARVAEQSAAKTERTTTKKTPVENAAKL